MHHIGTLYSGVLLRIPHTLERWPRCCYWLYIMAFG